MANELKADAILVFTLHGHMAHYASWMRPRSSPIYAICPNSHIAHTLVTNRGLTPYVIEFDYENPEKTIDLALGTLLKRGVVEKGHTLVIIGSISSGSTIVDAVQMRVV